MRTYLRNRTQGGTYFFTLALANRVNNPLLLSNLDVLRNAFRATFEGHPVQMEAVVILPEHLHCIWRLPPGDSDYATRWALIKGRFSRALPRAEMVSSSRRAKGERGVWQRRYWEHLIRDDLDYVRHVEYIHFNPVKHGYVKRPVDWPHSSFKRWVRRGMYAPDWGST